MRQILALPPIPAPLTPSSGRLVDLRGVTTAAAPRTDPALPGEEQERGAPLDPALDLHHEERLHHSWLDPNSPLVEYAVDC